MVEDVEIHPLLDCPEPQVLLHLRSLACCRRLQLPVQHDSECYVYPKQQEGK